MRPGSGPEARATAPFVGLEARRPGNETSRSATGRPASEDQRPRSFVVTVELRRSIRRPAAEVLVTTTSRSGIGSPSASRSCRWQLEVGRNRSSPARRRGRGGRRAGPAHAGESSGPSARRPSARRLRPLPATSATASARLVRRRGTVRPGVDPSKQPPFDMRSGSSGLIRMCRSARNEIRADCWVEAGMGVRCRGANQLGSARSGGAKDSTRGRLSTERTLVTQRPGRFRRSLSRQGLVWIGAVDERGLRPCPCSMHPHERGGALGQGCNEPPLMRPSAGAHGAGVRTQFELPASPRTGRHQTPRRSAPSADQTANARRPAAPSSRLATDVTPGSA